MKAIFINAKERKVSQVNISSDINEIREYLNCQYFTCYGLENGDAVYLDDEALLGNPRDFFELGEFPHPMAGNGLIIGTNLANGESEDCKSTVDEIDKDVIFMDIAAVLLSQIS